MAILKPDEKLQGTSGTIRTTMPISSGAKMLPNDFSKNSGFAGMAPSSYGEARPGNWSLRANNTGGILSPQKQQAQPSSQQGRVNNLTSNLSSGSLKVNDDGAWFTPKKTASSRPYEDTSTLGSGSSTGTADTVEARVAGMLEKDNPIIQNAVGAANRYSNSRGLLGSSINTTAAVKGAVESVTPIAQQDAGYFQNRGLQSQQGGISSRLQGEQGDISSRLQGEQGQISSKLQGEQGDISSRLQGEQGVIQTGLYETQGKISSKLQSEQGDITSRLSSQEANQASKQAAQQFGYSRTLQGDAAKSDMALKQADIAWNNTQLAEQAKLEREKMSAGNKELFDNITNDIATDYQNDFMEILLNPKFKTDADRQWALDALERNTKQRYETAASVAGIDLTWEEASGGNPWDERKGDEDKPKPSQPKPPNTGPEPPPIGG